MYFYPKLDYSESKPMLFLNSVDLQELINDFRFRIIILISSFFKLRDKRSFAFHFVCETITRHSLIQNSSASSFLSPSWMSWPFQRNLNFQLVRTNCQRHTAFGVALKTQFNERNRLYGVYCSGTCVHQKNRGGCWFVRIICPKKSTEIQAGFIYFPNSGEESLE